MSSSSRGAFVDPQGVRWDTNEADYEGWLNKKSRWVGEWRRRYFILKGSKLFFAKSNKESPHGMIDLVDCISVQSAEIKIKKKNAMLVSMKGDESWYIHSETDREKDEWISQIGRAILRHSSMNVGINSSSLGLGSSNTSNNNISGSGISNSTTSGGKNSPNKNSIRLNDVNGGDSDGRR